MTKFCRRPRPLVCHVVRSAGDDVILMCYLDAKPCELTCRAKGQKFYVRMSTVVSDGTRCDRADADGVCVNGKCLVSGA